MTGNSTATDFQFACHGLSDTWIFWVDENISSVYNQKIINKLNESGFKMYQF